MKRPLTSQCTTATALIFLGLGFHFFYPGEVLTLLVISGALILFAVLGLSCAFLVWQGYKRISAAVLSFGVMPPLPVVCEIPKGIE